MKTVDLDEKAKQWRWAGAWATLAFALGATGVPVWQVAAWLAIAQVVGMLYALLRVVAVCRHGR